MEWKWSVCAQLMMDKSGDKRTVKAEQLFPHCPASCLWKAAGTSKRGATEGWHWKAVKTKPEIRILNLKSCSVGRTECYAGQLLSKCKKKHYLNDLNAHFMLNVFNKTSDSAFWRKSLYINGW